MLWKWAKRRHPRKGHKWIKDRYWHPKGNRNWVFGTDKAILYSLSDTPIVRIPPLNLTKNPFLDKEYFDKRASDLKQRRITAGYSNTAARMGIYVL